MRIQVEERHIEAGIPRDCMKCPIALAAAEALHEPVHVGVFNMWWESDNAIHPLPDEADQFQQAFDAGDPVQPFSFSI